MTSSAITSDIWRAAMGTFPSGVTVVTSWNGDRAVGSTVSSFCSVSLEPPLLLVCIDTANNLNPPIKDAGVFGVHILSKGQDSLAMRFALEPEDTRFEGLETKTYSGGAPHITQACLFIDCTVKSIHREGTHDVVVGQGVRVVEGDVAPPLLYHKGAFLE